MLLPVEIVKRMEDAVNGQWVCHEVEATPS